MPSVFVVMTNDYPDCVFSEEWKAKIYVEMQQSWQNMHTTYGARIYYRCYEFEVDEPGRRLAQSTSSPGSQREPTKQDQEEFRASLRARWAERSSAEGASA